MILILLCVVPRVLSEVSQQHRFYLSRKSRSNSEPFETEYVYSQAHNPGSFSIFDTVMSSKHIDDVPSSEPTLESYSNTNEYVPSTLHYPHPLDLPKKVILSSSLLKSSMPKRDLYSKYHMGFLPSKIKTDAMYEKLKSEMYYKPSPTEMMYGYENEYHLDDDDVRTSSRGQYDSWPYYHHNPYEYEHMRIDAEREKAKDKRYAVDAAKIIPIHEDLSDDIPYSQEPMFATEYYRPITTDNPLSGNDPFFSFLLNDYYNKNYDSQDQLTYKELDWDKDFDDRMTVAGISDFGRRNRRLPSNYDVPENYNKIDSSAYHKQNEIEAVKSEQATERGFTKKNEIDRHQKGNAKEVNDKIKYKENGGKTAGYKDFMDTFANKFGSEDHKKDSSYILKTNQDKGENRKGFRRVYHKDEYQEDNEFYGNNNSSAQSEDKGSSNAHVGGSEALLKSHASANVDNQASAYDKSGNGENKEFESNHKAYDKIHGLDRQFNNYRDVAKKAAESNNADYDVNYRI